MTTATSTIEELANREYRVRLRHRHRGRCRAQGAQRGHRPASSRPRRTSRTVLLEWRLKAYRHWLTMEEPRWWPNVHVRADRLPGHRSTTRPRSRRSSSTASTRSIPEMRKTFEKLGISLDEQKRLSGVAVDAVFDSVSVATTFKDKLAELGIIFCSFSEAVQNHPELVKKYLGSRGAVQRQLLRGPELGGLQRRLVLLHPQGRALPDGAVHVLPHQRQGHGPVRADADRRRGGGVRQLPRRLHGPDARREPAARRRRRAGRRRRRTRRSSIRRCRTGTPATRKAAAASTTSSPSAAPAAAAAVEDLAGRRSRPARRITWKYPSCILQGDDSVGEFYSVALTNHKQQADTGTKMIHIGKNTKSTIVSQGHLGRQRAEHLPRPGEDPQGGRRTPATTRQCDSLLLGDRCGAHTFPYIEVQEPDGAGRARGVARRRSARTRSSTASSAASRRRTRST